MITITYNEGDRHWENEMEIEDSELAKTKKELKEEGFVILKVRRSK